MLRTTSLSFVAFALAVAAGTSGCTRGKVNDGGDYCALLAEQQPLIDSPIASELDIAPKISVYELLREHAPLDVEDQWQQIIDLVNAANAVDLTDQAAVAEVTDQAYSTARAAQSIVDHAGRLCGITLPGVGALPPPQVTISVPTTTIGAPTSST